jgi:hypothetical protein
LSSPARRSGHLPLLTGLLLCCGAGEAIAGPVFLAGPHYGNPSWGHAAVLLSDGKLLLAGTSTNNTLADLYDPAANTWTHLGPMDTSHSSHGTVLLPGLRMMLLDWGLPGNVFFDVRTRIWSGAPHFAPHDSDSMGCYLLPDGRLIRIGGGKQTLVFNNVSVFTPSTDTWSSLAPMKHLRSRPAVAPLLDGNRILVVGGNDGTGGLPSAELFDLAANTWTDVPDMALSRDTAQAITLSSGKVLVFGGSSDLSTVLFDPASGTWSAGGMLQRSASLSLAVLLPSGKVLDVQGENASIISQIYDPTTDTWSDGPPLSSGGVRDSGSATMLANGRVLVAGGSPNSMTIYDTTDLFDLGPGRWSAGPSLPVARASPSVTALPSGAWLIAGGQNGGGVLTSTLLISPSGTAASAAPMSAARVGHAAALLADGRAFVSGGKDAAGSPLASAELYDPALNTWVSAGAMAAPRSGHTATVLPNGKVLVVGGGSATCDLYDARAAQWSVAASLSPVRTGHRAVLLTNGKVLITGGGAPTAALYDPATDSWSAGATLNAMRVGHTATVLPSGKVLLAGGGDTSTELYDPAAGTSTPGPNLTASRSAHGAALLRSGKVLLAGGAADASPTAELYDPIDGSLVAVTSGAAARQGAAVLPLADGRVMLAGGQTSLGFSTAVELYDEGQAALAPYIPTLTALTSTGTGTVALTGATFQRAALGVTGSFYGSASNFPLLSLSDLDGPTQMALTTSWTPTAATVELPAGTPPGWWRARVVVSGVSSDERLWLNGAPGASCAGNAGCATGLCTAGICCDPACAPGACGGWCAPPQRVTASKLAFTTPSRTFVAGGCGGAGQVITVQLQDASGNPVQAGANGEALIASSTSTGTVTWFSDAACAATVLDGAFTVAAGSTTVDLYYRDTRAGTPTVSVSSASGLSGPLGQMHTVQPGLPARLVLSGIATPRRVGAVSDVTVEVDDALGNRAFAYSGTVAFTSTDASAQLPAPYTFSALEGGLHPFASAVRFNAVGTFSVTATDTQTSTLSGTIASIEVLQVQGGACAADSACETGACADGICCDLACTDGCSACNLGGAIGVCTRDPSKGCKAPQAPAALGVGCGCQAGAGLTTAFAFILLLRQLFSASPRRGPIPRALGRSAVPTRELK